MEEEEEELDDSKELSADEIELMGKSFGFFGLFARASRSVPLRAQDNIGHLSLRFQGLQGRKKAAAPKSAATFV
jgi:hypothetical protein